MALLTVSSKGQVVIPVEIRTRLGIGPGSTLELLEEGASLRLVVRRAVAESKLEDGYGLLAYAGPARRLAEFDVAQAMRDEDLAR